MLFFFIVVVMFVFVLHTYRMAFCVRLLVYQVMLQSVRVYDVLANSLKTKLTQKAAVLDCGFTSNETIVLGGLEKAVKLYHLWELHISHLSSLG